MLPPTIFHQHTGSHHGPLPKGQVAVAAGRSPSLHEETAQSQGATVEISTADPAEMAGILGEMATNSTYC